MDNFDTELAARVWQRVQGNPAKTETTHAPVDLLHSTLTDAAVFAAVARQTKNGLLKTLTEETQKQAARLRGICVCMDSKCPKIPVPSPGSEPSAVLIRRSYVNHLHRLEEYTRRSADTDFGPVYRELASMEQVHCATLMELLGHGHV